MLASLGLHMRHQLTTDTLPVGGIVDRKMVYVHAPAGAVRQAFGKIHKLEPDVPDDAAVPLGDHHGTCLVRYALPPRFGEGGRVPVAAENVRREVRVQALDDAVQPDHGVDVGLQSWANFDGHVLLP